MIIAYGEVLWDILPTGKMLGGAVGNCAYRLHQLGTHVSLISRIGDDELGHEALGILKDKELPCPLLQIDQKYPTGTVDVTISSEGDADYQINTGVAYDNIELTNDLLEAAKSADVILFGNLIQRCEKSRNTLYSLIEAAPQALKIVDINLRKDCFTKETVLESVSRTDVLKLNLKEVSTVSELIGISSETKEDFCDQVSKKYNVSTILITLGDDGIYAFDSKEGDIRLPGYNVKVADTVGSGDNFTAGFVHKRLLGESLEKCCMFANLIGSLVATKVGGMPSLTQKDIENHQATHQLNQIKSI